MVELDEIHQMNQSHADIMDTFTGWQYSAGSYSSSTFRDGVLSSQEGTKDDISCLKRDDRGPNITRSNHSFSKQRPATARCTQYRTDHYDGSSFQSQWENRNVTMTSQGPISQYTLSLLCAEQGNVLQQPTDLMKWIAYPENAVVIEPELPRMPAVKARPKTVSGPRSPVSARVQMQRDHVQPCPAKYNFVPRTPFSVDRSQQSDSKARIKHGSEDRAGTDSAADAIAANGSWSNASTPATAFEANDATQNRVRSNILSFCPPEGINKAAGQHQGHQGSCKVPVAACSIILFQPEVAHPHPPTQRQSNPSLHAYSRQRAAVGERPQDQLQQPALRPKICFARRMGRGHISFSRSLSCL